MLIVLNEGANRVWKRARNRFCVTRTLLVSVKSNVVFIRCGLLSVILGKMPHEQEQRDTSVLGKSKN
jgi:hypothetical protein